MTTTSSARTVARGARGRAVPVFNELRLHKWTGGRPCTLKELEAKYLRQSAGSSPDGEQGWLNWGLRRLSDERVVGTVQTTLSPLGTPGFSAELAWVVGSDHQGNGYAREAATAMVKWLRTHDVVEVTAHVHPQHEASNTMARALGMTTTNVVADGEVLRRGSGSWFEAACDGEDERAATNF
ncbi:N-acetyltransferase [Saccharopolyspora rhizosphaerae]|uniref:N-acetyltransferase n=1 Tax=Saccharopolyspora rhizosphaerae TaxID=2492662 RepID=A0A3R8QAR5_9PSEU|nr:N-acetyltransferase [Saccharopolyspora rhizosphaerae]